MGGITCLKLAATYEYLSDCCLALTREFITQSQKPTRWQESQSELCCTHGDLIKAVEAVGAWARCDSWFESQQHDETCSQRPAFLQSMGQIPLSY